MKTAIYSEDGWKAKVEILEDTSTEKYYQYKLKVLFTILDSSMFKTPPDGDIFTMYQIKDGFWGGMARLIDIQEEK